MPSSNGFDHKKHSSSVGNVVSFPFMCSGWCWCCCLLLEINCLFVTRFLGEKMEMEDPKQRQEVRCVLEQVKFEENRWSRNTQICYKLLNNKDKRVTFTTYKEIIRALCIPYTYPTLDKEIRKETTTIHDHVLFQCPLLLFSASCQKYSQTIHVSLWSRCAQ